MFTPNVKTTKKYTRIVSDSVTGKTTKVAYVEEGGKTTKTVETYTRGADGKMKLSDRTQDENSQFPIVLGSDFASFEKKLDTFSTSLDRAFKKMDEAFEELNHMFD